jgi:ribosome-associated protein
MPEQYSSDGLEAEEAPSKSARKRHMHRLQAIGESLVELNEKQLCEMPIDDERLLSAIRECRQMNSNNARKRHLQFIGKLMRTIDFAPIEQALQTLHTARQQNAAGFHQLEQLRTDILAAGTAGVEIVMAQFPDADRQHLRQLVLQHEREMQRNKPPAASRKLFSYLKELRDAHGDAD